MISVETRKLHSEFTLGLARDLVRRERETVRLRLCVRTSRAGKGCLLAILQEHKLVTGHVLAGYGG